VVADKIGKAEAHYKLSEAGPIPYADQPSKCCRPAQYKDLLGFRAHNHIDCNMSHAHYWLVDELMTCCSVNAVICLAVAAVTNI